MFSCKFPAKQKCNIIFLFHSAPYEALKILDKTYFNPTTSAVALDTRKTRAGHILFPPAPNFCSAPDIKTVFSAATIYQSIFIRNIKGWI
jgi:hypothetical protein